MEQSDRTAFISFKLFFLNICFLAFFALNVQLIVEKQTGN